MKFPAFYGNRNIHCRVYSSPPLYPILNQTGSVCTSYPILLRRVHILSSHLDPFLPSNVCFHVLRLNFCIHFLFPSFSFFHLPVISSFFIQNILLGALLLMITVRTSETSVSFYQCTRRIIPENNHLHPCEISGSHGCEYEDDSLDDGGSTHLWNVGYFLPDYTSQYTRRLSSLSSTLIFVYPSWRISFHTQMNPLMNCFWVSRLDVLHLLLSSAFPSLVNSVPFPCKVISYCCLWDVLRAWLGKMSIVFSQWTANQFLMIRRCMGEQ
jgi:hypothetical protein